MRVAVFVSETTVPTVVSDRNMPTLIKNKNSRYLTWRNAPLSCISLRQNPCQKFHQKFKFLMRVAIINVGIGISDGRF